MTQDGMRFDIAGVERETGIGKDTLRVWERRYGFPVPQRNERDERIYPEAQVERLRLVKRLLDRGMRPAKVVGLEVAALQALLGQTQQELPRTEALGAFIDLVQAHDAEGLRIAFGRALLAQGLERFLAETAAPLNLQVGEAWMRGEIRVFEEHLYSEQLGQVLRQAIALLQGADASPRVLLTTLPGEEHTLGLLMAEAILCLHGAACITLGAQTPVKEIVLAADAHRIDIVALSFSETLPATQVRAGIQQARAALPAEIGLWVGGAGVARVRTPAEGVQSMASLPAVAAAVADWRASAGRTAGRPGRPAP